MRTQPDIEAEIQALLAQEDPEPTLDDITAGLRAMGARWDKINALSQELSVLKGECQHPNATPPFDEAAACGLDAAEVRRRWPRGSHCPDCGVCGIFYASWAHYMMGDY